MDKYPKFDIAKWKAKLAEYNTPEIKAALNKAITDGTILSSTMLDEPNNDTD